MGKLIDALNWVGQKTKKVKDTFGTGIEALNPRGIAETVTRKKK